MVAISAHFDGKVIVPDEPVQLPVGRALIVRVESAPEPVEPVGPSALAWLAENAADRAALQGTRRITQRLPAMA